MSGEDTTQTSKRTPEEEERIRRYIVLLGFVFVIIVIWYGFDLANL